MYQRQKSALQLAMSDMGTIGSPPSPSHYNLGLKATVTKIDTTITTTTTTPSSFLLPTSTLFSP